VAAGGASEPIGIDMVLFRLRVADRRVSADVGGSTPAGPIASPGLKGNGGAPGRPDQYAQVKVSEFSLT
jgi:hypothetical protein